MFYSHQLLARKAPLGQIWMAATMHAKMNRRKLDKLNIIQICEEILNPSVPMALRLSGILMGGVVIVYERKVKLLYDDVTRLLVEINEAWKVKAVPDPTVLPKGKSQAKREAVTLPENVETDLGDIERPLHFSNTTATVGFQQTAYFAMRLDSVDESFVNNDPREDLSHHFHQVDIDNITLCERFDSYQADGNLHNRFERFDIEGDEETQLNFKSAEHTEIPTTLIPSPPPRDEPQQADEIHDHNPEFQVNQLSNEFKEAYQDQRGQGPVKKKTRRPATIVMDYDQTIISGHMYQSWLQGGSDLISNRGRKRKHADVMSTMKIADLMELPPVVLSCRLIANGNREIQYPAPLLELWRRSTQTPHDSPSRRTSPPLPPEPSSASPPNRVHYQEPAGLPFEDLYSGVGSQSVGTSIEKQRQNLVNNDMATENFMEELRANLANNEMATENIIEELRVNLMNNGVGVTESNLMATPGNSGSEVRSIPSSGSGPGVLHNWEVISGRLNKKRTGSSSRHGDSGLEPVAEENLWQHPDPNFKLRSQPEIGQTLEQELLVETGPTQTQRPHISQPIDKITDSIKMQMKTHFDMPGAPKIESLDSLAFGMNKTAAARLFYQTCVLATHDFLRVEQNVPYGDILISKGAKM